LIVTLRKQSEDGTKYFRPVPIEELLESLYQLSIEEVARRASIDDPDDDEYVPSECIVHFVRQSKACGDKQPYQDLFAILRKRVLRAVPVKLHKISGVERLGETDLSAEIRDQVLDNFQELLCLDRNEYDERLDFYEIRFNSAIALLRSTARRDVGTRKLRLKPMDYDGEAIDFSLEMEQALARIKYPDDEKEEDFLYRSRFYDAISTLQDNLPIDSKDPKILTIAEVLGCSEKTVRNLRDRAVATLRVALKEEEVA
jgi:hypothetical protein